MFSVSETSRVSSERIAGKTFADPAALTSNPRALIESVLAAAGGYVAAIALEEGAIGWLHPTEWELAWVSDVVLAVALGVAVYLWRHLLATRNELAERERAELVLQTQLSVASEIQRRLLPPLPPASTGLECAAALLPAGKIGGDVYDFVETSHDNWVVFVGDVSGKGIPAAMALGTLRSTFRTLARQGLCPAQIVTRLSATFLEEWRGTPYLTCVVLAVNLASNTLIYTNAGHPAGLVIGPHAVLQLNRGGPPAGLLPGTEFEQEMISFHTGDSCVVVTDGVTEALNGILPLEHILVGLNGARPAAAQLCDRVMQYALTAYGMSGVPGRDDDRTVVVVRRA